MKTIITLVVITGVIVGFIYFMQQKPNATSNSSSQTKPVIPTNANTQQLPSEETLPQPQVQQQSTVLNENKPAPEFTGITKWLNTERPLTLTELRGKVVLIDFWTYTCINCIRTLPYVTKWYDTYKDQGFVVIGVHTPEFAYEKKTENVLNAIKEHNIHYPVPQDNDFATWSAYDNQYWPAFYLIDANGIIRRTHFGEGEYDKTEQAIQILLNEAKL